MAALQINRSLAPTPGGKEETAILERRLLLQESVISAPSLKRVVDKLNEYRHAEVSSRDLAFMDLLREVDLFELEIGKSSRSIKMYEEERESYSKLADDISSDVTSTELEIKQLVQSLAEEKLVRKHLELVEEYAKEVAQLSSRRVLQNQATELENSLKLIVDNINNVESNITTRKEQFKKLQSALEPLLLPLQQVTDAVMMDEDLKSAKDNDDERDEDNMQAVSAHGRHADLEEEEHLQIAQDGCSDEEIQEAEEEEGEEGEEALHYEDMDYTEAAMDEGDEKADL